MRKMRKLKRFASVLLALVMCFGLTVTAFAADYSITVTNPDSGYTYTAYQVFTGDYDATAGTFTNIVWGSDITTDTTELSARYTALAAITDDSGSYPFTSDNTSTGTALTSAADVAAALAGYTDYDNTVAKAFADVIANYITGSGAASAAGTLNGSVYDYTISGLAAGYYLVETTGLPADGTYTRYILQVANNETIASKSETPHLYQDH